MAVQYHTARFRLVPQLAKVSNVPTPAVRKPGSAWIELPRPVSAGTEPVGHVRLGYACLDRTAVPGRAVQLPACRGDPFLRRARHPRRPRTRTTRPRHRTRHAR
ncbi:hypothetical protein [Streptomyces fulvoviolaceus]